MSQNRLLMNSQEWLRYKQDIENRKRTANKYLADPEYVRLYRQYLISKEAFLKAFSQAMKNLHLDEPVYSFDYRDKPLSPGPRRPKPFFEPRKTKWQMQWQN